MKCSDCKLWKTSECKNNPEVTDLDNAEAFACFVTMVGKEPTRFVFMKLRAIFFLVCGISGPTLLARPWIFRVSEHYIDIDYFLMSAFIGLIGVIGGAIYLPKTKEDINPYSRAMVIIGIISGAIGFLAGIGLTIVAVVYSGGHILVT